MSRLPAFRPGLGGPYSELVWQSTNGREEFRQFEPEFISAISRRRMEKIDALPRCHRRLVHEIGWVKYQRLTKEERNKQSAKFNTLKELGL